MFTIKDSKTGYVELNKSKFYSFAFHVEDVDTFKNCLQNLRKENSKAKHAVYAYRIGVASKSCDDGEPKGTGGRPILELLNKKNLNNVGIIVIRYFGGSELGAGRLLRCYLNSAIDAINKCELVEE